MTLPEGGAGWWWFSPGLWRGCISWLRRESDEQCAKQSDEQCISDQHSFMHLSWPLWLTLAIKGLVLECHLFNQCVILNVFLVFQVRRIVCLVIVKSLSICFEF